MKTIAILMLVMLTVAQAEGVDSRRIYAAQNDGTIHVYNIDDHHAEVKVIRVFGCCADVRGIAAAVVTHRLYVMYNRDKQGRVAALDLLTDQVVWDRVLHTPGVDRGNLTPDGSTLYLPTWEDDPASPSYAIIAERFGRSIGGIGPMRARCLQRLRVLLGEDACRET